ALKARACPARRCLCLLPDLRPGAPARSPYQGAPRRPSTGRELVLERALVCESPSRRQAVAPGPGEDARDTCRRLRPSPARRSVQLGRQLAAPGLRLLG